MTGVDGLSFKARRAVAVKPLQWEIAVLFFHINRSIGDFGIGVAPCLMPVEFWQAVWCSTYRYFIEKSVWDGYFA